MKKYLNTILIITFSLLFAFAFGTVSPANAADRDLVVSGGEEGTDYTYEDGVLTILKDGNYTISMAEGVDETSDRIFLDNNSGLSSATITLDSVKMKTDGPNNISLSPISTNTLDLTLVLQGDNSLTSSADPYSCQRNVGNLTISGGGSLTVESTGSDDPSMNGRNFTLESGTVTLKNCQVRTDSGGIYIKGGSLSITSASEGLYTNTEYNQTGGTVEVTAPVCGLFVTGFRNAEPSDGIKITGGDLTLTTTNGNSNCINAGQYSTKNILIDTDGTVTLNSPYLGVVLQNGSSMTMNGTLLKIEGPLIGIYPVGSPASEFHVNGGETEIISSLRAIDLGSASNKTILYSEDYFHKNYDGEAQASRTEVSDTDILNANGRSQKYVLITPAYRITYDLGGGSLPDGASNPVKYSRVDEFTLVNPVGSSPFTGWTGTDLDGLTTDVTIPEGSKGDRSYTAHYQEDTKQYKIIYDPNGGTLRGSTENLVETHDAGETITIAEAPERSGYTFQYWEGSRYDPGDSYVVEGDHTFTAVWEKNGGGDDDEGDKDDKDGSASTGDFDNLLPAALLLTMSLLGMLLLLRRHYQ